LREPLAFAQRDAGQEPNSISEDEPDNLSGYQLDSVAVTGRESMSRYEPDSDSGHEPESVSFENALA
jgi:hypothetical protein